MTRSKGSSRCATNGNDRLLDTNVVLYLLGGRLAAPLPERDYGVLVITEMELLAWPTLTEEEVRAFLVCELTPAIRERAVALRRSERLKLPDAIICATALEHGVELWTNDARLAKVPGVTCRTAPIVP
jgi:hypothetical protein